MKITMQILHRLLEEVQSIQEIVPLTDDEVEEIEATYIPREFSKEREERDLKLLHELIKEFKNA